MRFRARALALFGLVAAILLVALPARAGDVDSGPPGRRIAILVGANDPAPGRQALRYAHADAQLMADTLLRVGRFAKEDVRVLLEPHPGEILAALERTSRDLSAAPGESLLVFYYSGHSDGQRVYPHGEPLALAELRERLQRSSARVRIAIVDTCRGGSWTQAKGLSVGPPLDAMDLMNVAAEGTALLSSSSGIESAHEAGALHGSFFTHHLAAGLLGAADASGDGNVSLQEAFVYAKERTVRDSAQMAATTQHPSFDMQLRGRQDIVLTRTTVSKSALVLSQTDAVQVIHLGSGATVAETAPGARQIRLALVPGRYVVRRVTADGHVRSKAVEIGPNATVTLSDADLDTVGGGALAMKNGEDPKSGAAPEGSGAEGKKKNEKRGKKKHCTPCCNDGDDDDDDDDHDDESEHEHEHEHEHEGKRCRHSWNWKFENEVIAGVRGSLTLLNGSDRDRTEIGATFTVAGEHYYTEGLWTHRGNLQLALGGGTAGLEGALGGGGAFGVRLPVAEHHGPIARIGTKGELIGNSHWYFSQIALPEGEVGYQYSEGRTLFEVGGRAAAIVTGRYNTGNVTRRELGGGTAAFTGYLAAHLPFGRLDVSYEHIGAGDNFPGGPVHVLRGWLCGYLVQHVAVCADGMFIDGQASHPDFGPAPGLAPIPTRVDSFFGGITIGGAT
jgi:hypothetical protein